MLFGSLGSDRKESVWQGPIIPINTSPFKEGWTLVAHHWIILSIAERVVGGTTNTVGENFRPKIPRIA